MILFFFPFSLKKNYFEIPALSSAVNWLGGGSLAHQKKEEMSKVILHICRKSVASLWLDLFGSRCPQFPDDRRHASVPPT